MKTKYIIYNYLQGGFWASSSSQFRGILFATYFDTKEDAVRLIQNMKLTNCTIFETYI